MLLWLALVLIALFATIFVALVYFGLFHAIDVKAGVCPIDLGGKEIGYKLFQSSYREAGHAFTELYALLARNGCVTQDLTTIGVYYDDPCEVRDENKCKFIVGCLMPNDDSELSSTTKQLLSRNEYKFVSLPNIDHVVYTSFPFRGAVSVILAMKRVYPLLKAFIKEHNLCAHPSIELYNRDQIHFIVPLAKQDQFYFFDDTDELSDSQTDSDRRSSQGTEDEEIKNSSNEQETNGGRSNATSSQSSRSSFEELNLIENNEKE